MRVRARLDDLVRAAHVDHLELIQRIDRARSVLVRRRDDSQRTLAGREHFAVAFSIRIRGATDRPFHVEGWEGGPWAHEVDPEGRSTYHPSVLTSFLQRATAWLCLGVALLTGVTPAQGFVLCFEPDGRTSIEVAKAAERCSGCESQEAPTTPTSPSVRLTHETGCPCQDVSVPGRAQDLRLQPRPIELQIGPCIAAPPTLLGSLSVSSSPVVHAPPTEVPRPPDTLELIRSVVLLV